MKNKKTLNILAAIAVVAIAAAVGFWAASPKTLGSAPIGLPASVATVRIIDVGPGMNVLLFNGPSSTTPTGNICTSRVISTVGKPIMLKFATTSEAAIGTGSASSSVPILWGYAGHVQGASTTVAYDSGIYGCPFVGAYGFDATTSIMITEFR